MTGTGVGLVEWRFRESWHGILVEDVVGGRSFTYGDLWRAAVTLGRAWTRGGATPGRTVALHLHNGPAFLCCYLAAMLGGYIGVPVNREWAPATVDHVLRAAKPALVVSEPPDVEALKAGDDTPGLAADLQRDSESLIGAIFFTSGTTGQPKGVCHTWTNLIDNACAFNRHMGLDETTRAYHVLPMAYMAGFLNTMLSPLMAGGTIIMGPRFGASSAFDFWSLPEEHAAQTLWVTPTIAAGLLRLCRDPERARAQASGFRHVFCGTAPLHGAVRAGFHETFGLYLQESYGTSELLLVSAQSRADAECRSDVGMPLPELELTVQPDQDGRDELVVRSPYASRAYLTEKGSVPGNLTEDGFVRTGDAGYLAQGRLVITDRLKDLIIRGGLNVSAIALENTLMQVPGVVDAAVVGVPHSFWGEMIVACLLRAEGIDPADLEDSVRRHCRVSLSRAEQPDRIVIVDHFPRAVTGKVQKAQLRAELTP